MTLYDLLYLYFEQHIFNDGGANDELGSFTFELFNNTLSFRGWLCHTASIISITIIVVLCAMFVYKIIKLIGGLIR